MLGVRQIVVVDHDAARDGGDATFLDAGMDVEHDGLNTRPGERRCWPRRQHRIIGSYELDHRSSRLFPAQRPAEADLTQCRSASYAPGCAAKRQ